MTDAILFASQPTLVGEAVTLRPFEAADADAMLTILRDPELRVLTGSTHSRADAEADDTHDARIREWYASRAEQRDRIDLAIVDRSTGRVVGESVVNDWSPEDESANFRILIGPEGRGRGLGTEATRLTVRLAFTATTLHRLELEVFAFNPRARRAYEKAGFVYEGTRRQAFKLDDERVDAVVMSILRPEWEAAGAPATPAAGIN